MKENVGALAGARIRAGCERRSRTRQISRKRSYKTLDLRGHKSIMAITPPERPFFVKPEKKSPVARTCQQHRFRAGFSTQKNFQRASVEDWRKFGQTRRGTRRDEPGLPSRNSHSRFEVRLERPCRLRAVNAFPLPARFSRGERAEGVGQARRRRAVYFT